MTSKDAQPRTHGRLYRTLAAFSAHTVESYWTVWSSGHSPRRRTAEEIALHG